jgi:sugar phosphate permease
MIADPTRARERAGWRVMTALVAGYVGIYLCRKNLSVAVPLLQTAFHAKKADVGWIASIGTLTYALGKVINGPIVDRLGGRRGFLLAIVAVGLFGAAGAFSPGLFALTILYGINRFAGSAGWGGMIKLVPSWFGPPRRGTVLAVLSLGYVGGGALATLLARQILGQGGGWRAVMGVPSLFLAAILVGCFFTVREGPLAAEAKAGAEPEAPAIDAPAIDAPAARSTGAVLVDLLGRPQFLVTCALSFTLTLMRETFNTWSVDFLVSIQGGTPSVMTAALQSTVFDVAGIVAILGAGVAYDRVRPDRRRFFMAGCLALLAAVVALLPVVAASSTAGAAVLVGVVGLLVYGPYSLLAGALAVESGGKEAAATAAGIIDGVGYLAGAMTGVTLGKLLDVYGYPLGFRVLSLVTMISAGIALGLRPASSSPPSSPR